tara:strand:+ start:7333 stop:7566 length:234 start_codon:yes stop_codon:yes gene_type:complete
MGKIFHKQAFPSLKFDGAASRRNGELYFNNESGMGLRDYFAAKAMQSLLNDPDAPFLGVTKAAYEIADGMMEERQKD